MAKRGGFPGMGMPGNMNNLMKQAQKMQRQMEENQKALEEKEFTATAGGGAVEVTISGKREVTKVKLRMTSKCWKISSLQLQTKHFAKWKKNLRLLCLN